MEQLVMYYDRPQRIDQKKYGFAVRIHPETYERVRKVCDACRMTNAKVLDVLIGYALDNLQLKQRPVYDIAFKNAGGEEADNNNKNA